MGCRIGLLLGWIFIVTQSRALGINRIANANCRQKLTYRRSTPPILSKVFKTFNVSPKSAIPLSLNDNHPSSFNPFSPPIFTIALSSRSKCRSRGTSSANVVGIDLMWAERSSRVSRNGLWRRRVRFVILLPERECEICGDRKG